jgi:hypothetical protein
MLLMLKKLQVIALSQVYLTMHNLQDVLNVGNAEKKFQSSACNTAT